MKKYFLTLLLCCCTIICAQAQLLWRVSGNGLKSPSYVMGTYHLAKVAFVDSVPQLRQAMSDCQQVAGEMDMTKLMNDGDAIMRMHRSMMLPEGTTIEGVLSGDELSRFNAFLTNTLGGDFKNPMLVTLARMKPAAILTQLQVVLCMKMDPGFNPNEQFDTYFQQFALDYGKQVVGLETMDEQVDLLFNQTSLKRQAEQLMCLVDDPDYQTSLLRRIIGAYYAQDLDRVETLMSEKRHNTCDSTPEEEELLIYARNARWAKALPSLMAARSTLVVVGAAHLPGNRGLLELLRKAGYEVTPCR